ncbi:reverse transcriptase [Senna tora]|uniref:Reverse transcriptase n=1 Tax=Senna tora TaxID=362788 RepID=A0A834WJT1_9FABA|nr:reverse transcriptase [Senna tora]
MQREVPGLPGNADAKSLQLNLEMAWNGSSIVIMEPQQQQGSVDSSEETTDPDHLLTITGEDNEGGELQQHNGHNLIVMENRNSSNSEESSSNEDNKHQQRTQLEVPREYSSRKRKLPFEMELIEQFVKQKGKIGPVRLTLTLKASKQRKRKAVQIEEMESTQKTPTVNRLKGLCLKHLPDLLFLQETKCTAAKMSKWNRLRLFDYSFFVDPIGRNFNQVANIQEKMSQCQSILSSEDLNNTVNHLGLVDLQTVGNWFTWTNGRQGEDLVWEHLDKTFANTDWMQKFPDSWVDVLPVSGSMATQLQDKIRNVSKDHSHWHKENFGNLSHQIREAQHQVETLQLKIQHHNRNNEELIAQKKLEFLLECEEIKWVQRAKQFWLLKGDRNTNNDVCDDHARKSFISNSGIPKLNQDHVRQLSQSFTKMEIEDALFQMNGNKSPGPNEMSPITMNQTHIALIPKVDSPQGFKEYRPIKRLILDNILVASEILHYIRGCKKNKGGWAALKVDLHKAYDKISWSFLKEKGGAFEKYLGGFIDGHDTSKRNASLILDNIHQRLVGWKAKMLSQAARTTIIKAVVSAIPLFHMQHTWLSHSQADKCDAVIRKFF